MRKQIVGAALGLSLAFGAQQAVQAQEQWPMSMTATDIEIANNQAQVWAEDEMGGRHVFVFDLSQLSAEDRQALGLPMMPGMTGADEMDSEQVNQAVNPAGDVSEQLGTHEQDENEDDTANGGSQPNAPST